jgi:hypothetical protein
VRPKMKSLNGLLFILIGGAIIWIGATGRFPALGIALGVLKASPGSVTKSDSGAISKKTGSVESPTSSNMLLAPQSEVWKSAMEMVYGKAITK